MGNCSLATEQRPDAPSGPREVRELFQETVMLQLQLLYIQHIYMQLYACISLYYGKCGLIIKIWQIFNGFRSVYMVYKKVMVRKIPKEQRVSATGNQNHGGLAKGPRGFRNNHSGLCIQYTDSGFQQTGPRQLQL